jgi:hypothetical protein
MNIGIYIDTLSDTQQLEAINAFVNNVKQDDRVTDVSIFYNGIGFNPFDIKCGMFNSTDLWNFHGKLIVSSLNCLASANNIVNNLELYYYYGWENAVKVLDILQLIQNNVPVICRSENDKNFIYRITGKTPLCTTDNFQDILKAIL